MLTRGTTIAPDAGSGADSDGGGSVIGANSLTGGDGAVGLTSAVSPREPPDRVALTATAAQATTSTP